MLTASPQPHPLCLAPCLTRCPPPIVPLGHQRAAKRALHERDTLTQAPRGSPITPSTHTYTHTQTVHTHTSSPVRWPRATLPAYHTTTSQAQSLKSTTCTLDITSLCGPHRVLNQYYYSSFYLSTFNNIYFCKNDICKNLVQTTDTVY